MKKAILFDLGNTLIQYFERSEFPGILREAIEEAYKYLCQDDKFNIPFDNVWERVKTEDHESKDYSVRSLENRLKNIFMLDNLSDESMMSLCRYFMKPIFSKSCIYDDTLPILSKLKSNGIKMAIISNTTWGSPAELWNEEIKRFGLTEYVDMAIFCRDVGWRKPDSRIFEYALEKLSLKTDECIFIGDDPRWDIAGPKAIGMEAILINRKNVNQEVKEQEIGNLYEIIDVLKINDAL